MLLVQPRRPAIARSGMVRTSGLEYSEQPLPSADSSFEEVSVVWMEGTATGGLDFANFRIDLYSVAKCGLVTLCEHRKHRSPSLFTHQSRSTIIIK